MNTLYDQSAPVRVIQYYLYIQYYTGEFVGINDLEKLYI